MAFLKLDCGILDSTVWTDRDVRDVWITALLMAKPYVLSEPTEQLEVRTAATTGWVVPPGAYGFIEAAGVGIARRALVESEAGLVALEVLGGNEPDSRTPTHDGRRLVRIPGGYLVLNYALYRERDHTAAERMRRFRSKTANVTRNVTPERVTLQKQRAEAESREQRAEAAAPAPNGTTPNPKAHVTCPPDLQLTADERGNIKMGKGIPDYAIDHVTVSYRTKGLSQDPRTLGQWRRGLVTAIMADWRKAPKPDAMQADAELSADHARFKREREARRKREADETGAGK